MFATTHRQIVPKAYITDELAKLVAEAEKSQDTAWAKYFNFDALLVPKDLWMIDPFFAWLSLKYTFQVGILKMRPHSCYNWHTDDARNLAINMLLPTDGRSHCIFATTPYGLIMSTEELEYGLDTYYVFNTKVPHIVFNADKPRYLLSVEFLGRSAETTFNDLCAYLDSEGMLHD